MRRAGRKFFRANQFFTRPDPRKGIEPIGDGFAKDEHIGNDAEVFPRPEFAGAINAHLDFIGYQQNVALF